MSTASTTSSRGFATSRFDFRIQFVEFTRLKCRNVLEVREKKRRKVSLLWKGEGSDQVRVNYCCSDSTMPKRRNSGGGGGGGCSGKSGEKIEDWRFDSKKMPPSVRVRATPAMPFPSPQYIVLFLPLPQFLSPVIVESMFESMISAITFGDSGMLISSLL